MKMIGIIAYATLLSFTIFGLPPLVYAQSGQILSVTPPLFQLSVAPGDIWQSSIKVVNGNNYDLTVYAEVVNFASQGEQGQGRFIPLLDEEGTEGTLAEWIEIAEGPHVIKAEQTKELTFFVDVPDDAPPGGHFAAILIGTAPPTSDSPLVVQTSQVVTSLFFTRIEGDVLESALIREFRMEDSFVERPEAEFVLRFENKGNVHLQPRGEIRITNMWGSERGVIPVNYQSHFGNVLPESIREFRFSWKGEPSFTEIGRYTAVATLAYGENGIQNVDAITHFWVIPVKATLITLGSIISFFLFIAWAIRLYVRRMLALAGVDVANKPVGSTQVAQSGNDLLLSSYKNVSAPLKVGAHDLKERLSNANKFFDHLSVLFSFIASYKTFFLSLALTGIGILGAVIFITGASKDQRSYEVIIEHEDGSTVVDSEEILKEKLQVETARAVNPEQHFSIEIINASGEAGVAAQTAISLEEAGYVVASTKTSDEGERKQSVILYEASVSDEAIALSSILNGVLLSALPESNGDVPLIRVILGSDRVR